MSSIVSALTSLPFIASIKGWIAGESKEVVDFPKAIDALFEDDFFDNEIDSIS